MLCSISGEPCEVPVVSKLSGHVYEKRLAEAHIRERGTDPESGEACTIDDLVEIRNPTPTVRPRPGTLTSVPSLLGALQTEWDALALETHELKQQLARTKGDLSIALYRHDAAVRVAARLTKERDEARKALASLSASLGHENGASHPESADVQMEESAEEKSAAGGAGPPVPDEVVQKIEQTAGELAPGRKNRQISEGLQTVEGISGYKCVHQTKQLFTTLTNHNFGVSRQDDLVVSGGGKSQAGVFSVEDHSMLTTAKCSGNVTSARWLNNEQGHFAVGLKTGNVEVYDQDGVKQAAVELGTKINDLAVLPSGYIAGVTEAAKLAIIDIARLAVVYESNEFSDQLLSVAIHPDGKLAAVGTKSGSIHIIQLTTAETAHTFEHEGAVETLCFSENGYSLAAGGSSTNNVTIYHLGKQTVSNTLDNVGPVSSVQFDVSGNYLAVGGTAGVFAFNYVKKGKSWNQVYHNDAAALAVDWGYDAKKLVAITPKGNIQVHTNE